MSSVSGHHEQHRERLTLDGVPLSLARAESVRRRGQEAVARGERRAPQLLLGHILEAGGRSDEGLEQTPSKLKSHNVSGGHSGISPRGMVSARLFDQLRDEWELVLQPPDWVAVEDGSGQHPKLPFGHEWHIARSGHGRAQLLARMVEHGRDQRFLGAEMPVHEAMVDPGTCGHLADGSGGGALGREQVGGRIEHRRHDVGPTRWTHCSHMTTVSP